jgi:hypothetical protein
MYRLLLIIQYICWLVFFFFGVYVFPLLEYDGVECWDDRQGIPT